MSFSVAVSWPSAPLTESLVRRTLQRLPCIIAPSLQECANAENPTLIWSTYDAIDHEQVFKHPTTVLSSSLTIRKALTRKHFLHRCVKAYTTKHRSSILTQNVPTTWDVDIAFADELEEFWEDELFDLAQLLDNENGDVWFILKPGMADRGIGIRLFNSKEVLREIFEEFERDSDTEEKEILDCQDGVVISQLRHFVIQEYLLDPLLLDPFQIATDVSSPRLRQLAGHKFHLRAYCVVSGALSVYLYPRVLALFSSKPYTLPSYRNSGFLDLQPHLTNTSIQEDRSEDFVKLLSELVGSKFLSGSTDQLGEKTVSENDLKSIMNQISDLLGETFNAALQMPVHFQPLPNAFELYGVDFLVTHSRTDENDRFRVNLLEINSEPAIEMTGARLLWVLEDLFDLIGKYCIAPFFGIEAPDGLPSIVGDHPLELQKCFDIRLKY